MCTSSDTIMIYFIFNIILILLNIIRFTFHSLCAAMKLIYLTDNFCIRLFIEFSNVYYFASKLIAYSKIRVTET